MSSFKLPCCETPAWGGFPLRHFCWSERIGSVTACKPAQEWPWHGTSPNHQLLFPCSQGRSQSASRVKSSSYCLQHSGCCFVTQQCREKTIYKAIYGHIITNKVTSCTTKEIYCSMSVNISLQKGKKKCQQTLSRQRNGSKKILPASFFLEGKSEEGQPVSVFVCVFDWHAFNQGCVIMAVAQNDVHLHAGVTFHPKETKQWITEV